MGSYFHVFKGDDTIYQVIFIEQKVRSLTAYIYLNLQKVIYPSLTSTCNAFPLSHDIITKYTNRRDCKI